MQKIYLKKKVDLNNQLKELQSISVDESINYKLEQNGMRAVGCVMIKGEFKDNESLRNFEDSIELDLFADFNKIVDKRDFQVKIDDFDYFINNGNLNISIQASVHGVKDDMDRVVEADDSEELLQENEIIDDVYDAVNEAETIMREIEVENKEVSAVNDELVSDLKNIENNENDDIGLYYFYVVKDTDTYEKIALSYNVDAEKLRTYNHDKDINKGSIVIVPYGLC